MESAVISGWDEEFHVFGAQTGDGKPVPRAALLSALVTIVESISKFYEESGLSSNIVMALFNRVTRVRIPDSPVIFKEGRFQAVADERDSESILESFKMVIHELHKAMAVLLGSKVVSSRYQNAYEFLMKKFAITSAEAGVMSLIPPDRANI